MRLIYKKVLFGVIIVIIRPKAIKDKENQFLIFI